MKKLILLHLFTLCTVLCTYSQSAVYVIFTSTNSDDKGVNNLIFDVQDWDRDAGHLFSIFERAKDTRKQLYFYDFYIYLFGVQRTAQFGYVFVRLDGSPNYAMWCNAIPAVINIVLDYVFIFIFGWEMMGAALATSLGYVVGAAMIIIYLSRKKMLSISAA